MLPSNLSSFYNYIYEMIGKTKNFYKIMSKLLFNEFRKVIDKDYRIKILEIMFEKNNNNFIIHSSQIIKIIIKIIISNSSNDSLVENFEILYNNESPFISLLNKINNPFFDEIILNIFEGEILYFFKSIPLIKDNYKNKEPKNLRIVFDQSYQIFKTLIDHLELIVMNDNKCDNIKYSNLSKLFSIAYIKIYLSYLVSIMKDMKEKIGKIEDIINFICKKRNKFRNIIKIYILKLFNNLIDDFDQFKNFNFDKCGIHFHKEYSLWNEQLQKNGENLILNYCLMTIDEEKQWDNYIQQKENFDNWKNDSFRNDNNNLIKNINENGIDAFLCIAINYIITLLDYNDVGNKDEFKKFSDSVKQIFNQKYECNQKLKDLLLLFFDYNKFNEKIKSKLIKNDNFNSKLFETLLYSFRFCVQSLDELNIQKGNKENKKLLFASILDKNCINNINECYIPGNEIPEDLQLTNLELVEKHINHNSSDIGCYVCSCGYYYSIEPCGFPLKGVTSLCPICKLSIGYGEKKVKEGSHSLVRRPGHMRIFKDKQQKENCMKQFHDSEENIPSMIYTQYLREIIQPILNTSKNGLNAITKDYFTKRNKKIRELNELSYRILNYILYSHLFFANCLDYISDDDLKQKYLVKDMGCIEIIEKDWEFIQEILQQKGIQSIQIFMNLIFKRFSDLIKKCEYFEKDQPRNEFEKEVEKLINICLLQYNDYSIRFIKENKRQLELDNYNIKTIINELCPPTEDIYPFKDYPLLKYFVLTKYSKRDEFIKKLGPSNIYILKYPLLHQYLLENIDTKKLKYLPDFNEFTNYMVDYYSFKISRDDAKNKVLKNEPIFKEQGFTNKFKKFISAWNEIKSKAIKYKCRVPMKPIELSENDRLIYFLNDDGEIGNGMYLAAACQNFITWQNTFLQPIIDSVAQNGILHYFSKNMKKKIPVQNAKINQTLLLEDCFNNSIYYDLDDIISTYSRRDIFKEDGTINYFNYNSFIYDFESIEEELGKILLPGKCLFDNEDNLNFMTYWSEGYRGGKSDTLSVFYLKYPQKDLNDEEKKYIIDYIEQQRSKKNYDFKPILGSMQLIIFYLTNNLYKKDEKIINILSNTRKYLKIEDNCYKLFENEGKNLSLEKLMNVYFFFEHICFRDLVNTLDVSYKKDIEKPLKEEIKSKLYGHKKNEIYTVSQLAAALRRFISRYLVGERQSFDIDEKTNLTDHLSRIDLWEQKIGKLDDLNVILSLELDEFKLKVGQAYNFYQLLADSDLNPIVEISLKERKK